MSKDHPWDELPTDKDKIQYLQLKLNLTEDIDAVKERCFTEHKNLAATLNVVFKCIHKHLFPNVIFLQTQNEDLVTSTYSFGITKELLEQKVPELLCVSRATRHTVPGLDWYAIPLDMAGETIGSLGMAFSPSADRRDSIIFDLLTAISEELDDYFYAIQSNRIKYMTILEIQRSLKSKNLNEAVDLAVNVMSDLVPVQDLVLMFLDEDTEGNKTLQYQIYRDYQKLFDSVDKPMPEMERLIKSGKDLMTPGDKDLETIIQIDGATETLMMDGLVNETLVGKILARPSEGNGFSISSREILQVFSESLRQRLVDYNKEKNSLRQFFSPEITRKLLKISDYEKKYLSPHNAEIGILYADISGFTKICEQVLKEPDAIARFFNRWSHGVVEKVFLEGGSLDKFVGDCLIALFGPPFYSFTPQQAVTRAMRTAVGVRSFTQEFLKLPENAAIQKSITSLGVGIGINFCPASVGLLGPNNDLTAFSSGMNNTARLQSQAKCNEILVTAKVKDLVEQAEGGTWSFEGPLSAVVKNVKDPLVYFKLKG